MFATLMLAGCLLFAPATVAQADRLLVAIEGGGVVQLSAKTGTVLETYRTGANAFGVAWSADGTRAFATDKDAGTLCEIDPATDGVLETLAVGAGAQQPAITADGRAYIPLSGEAAIAVVSLSRPPTLLRKISTGAGSKPHIVSLSPDGRTLWATVQGTDPRVVAIGITPAGEEPARDFRNDIVPRVVCAVNGGAYFTGHHSTGVHFVDLAAGTVTTPWTDANGTFSEPRKQIEGVSASADGRVVAVTHEGRRQAIVLYRSRTSGRLRTLARIGELDDNPYWVTLDPSGLVIYVSIPGAGTVEAYDLMTGWQAPAWTANVGGKPKRLAAR